MGEAMPNPNIEDAIAVRKYDLSDGRKIHAYLWPPVSQPTGEYSCCFQIKGIDDEKIRTVHGIDSLQALVLAQNAILGNLCSSNEYKAGKLTWFGSRYLGLAVPKYLRRDTPEEDED